MADIREIFQEFLRFENDLNLFESRIQGVRFWEIIRCPIFFHLSRMKTIENTSKIGKISFIDRLKFYLSAIIQLNRNPFFGFRKDIFFFCNTRRVLREDGSWWDIYTDYIIDELDISFHAVEQSLELRHRSPSKTKGLRYFDFLDVLLLLSQILNLPSIAFTKQEQSLLQSISSEIHSRFNIEIDIEKFVKRRLRRRRIRVSFYKWLFRWIKPKAAIVTTDCGMEDFIESAKSLKIPVVEFQHGNISPYHPAYSFPGEARTKYTFANYLFVFGNYWKDAAEFPIESERILSVGFPFLEEAKSLQRTTRKKKQILVISQHTIGESLSKLTSEISKIPEFDYNIVYKLHPAEYSGWRSNYPWLMETNIDVIDSSEPSLYKLFAESEIQVGVYSTAIYEGIAFGLRTFLYDLDETIHMQYLLETGIAESFSSVDEFVEKVGEVSKTHDINQNFLFQRNAVRNTINAIKQIIESGKAR